MTWVYPLEYDHGLPLAEVTNLVGGKAANLGVMARELGLPVPPGIAITTEACRAYLARGWPSGLDQELRAGIAGMERALGRRFGDPADPLLVSVRSGAPVSMPGMMDTILDLGLNKATVVGLGRASDDERFAQDCRRRFQSMFREIVGRDAPEDPWEQLRSAVEAVFGSWNSDRARAYRKRETIPDDLGTGVVVQAMVFGNRGDRSATGVAFTRDPATGQAGLYGDVMFDAQGEDVVAGTHATEPLTALDERLPSAAVELRRAAALLELHYRDLCDIEFTIEDGRLWMLQVRVGKRSPRAALRIAVDMAEDPGFPLSRAEAVDRVRSLLVQPPRVAASLPPAAERLVVGLPASPGIASGEIATTPEDAVSMADAGRAPILVRNETSPDDVHGMARSAAILTATGGLASHAAVVARGWGIPAVVGASAVRIVDGEVRFPGGVLRSGDVITVDGDGGGVYRGAAEGSSGIAPEAETLLGWARELGIAIEALGSAETGRGEPGAEEHHAGRDEAPTEGGSPGIDWPTPDDCVRALAIKGFATTDGLAQAVLAEASIVAPLLDGLVAAGLAATTAGTYRLTDVGRTRADELATAERAAVGSDAADAALDAFLAIDRRVKEVVTDWQIRPIAAGPSVNDHADAAYDRSVLDRLAAAHSDAASWIAPLTASWPRAATYRDRLHAALERALGGDGRYVASPRVDSYHGVWFELHEDLIRLAGRTREDEVAAGRA